LTSDLTIITFNQSVDDKFLASWNSSTEAESYMLAARVFTKNDKNRTTIKNKVTDTDLCEDLEAADTCTVGNVVLTVGRVYKQGSEKWVNLSKCRLITHLIYYLHFIVTVKPML